MDYALVNVGDPSISGVEPFAMRGLSCKKALALLNEQKVTLKYGRTISYPWNGYWEDAAILNVFGSLAGFYPEFSTTAGQHSTIEHHDNLAKNPWANSERFENMGNQTHSIHFGNHTNHTGDIIHPDVKQGSLVATAATLLLPLATPLAWLTINGVHVCKDWWYNSADRRHNAAIDRIANHVRTLQVFAATDKDARLSPALVPMLWPYLTAKELGKLNFAQLQPMAATMPSEFQAVMLGGNLSAQQQNFWSRLQTLVEIAFRGGNFSEALNHSLSKHCIATEPLFLTALSDAIIKENPGLLQRSEWAALLSQEPNYAQLEMKQQKKILDLIEQGICASLYDAFAMIRSQGIVEADLSLRLADDVIISANGESLTKASSSLAELVNSHQGDTEIDWSHLSVAAFTAMRNFLESGELGLEQKTMQVLQEIAAFAQQYQVEGLHRLVQEKLAYLIPDLDAVQIEDLLVACSDFEMPLLNACVDNHLAHASRWHVSRVQPFSLQFVKCLTMATKYNLSQYGSRLHTHFSQQLLQLSQASDSTPPSGFEHVLVALANKSTESIQAIWPALYPLLEVNQPLLGVIWAQAAAEKQMEIQRLVTEFCTHPDTHHIFLHPSNSQIAIPSENEASDDNLLITT